MEDAVLQGEDPATRWAGRDDVSSREARHRHASRQVLVLNRNWQAVSIVGVRRAFNLLFRDHARIINPDSAEHSPYDIGEWIDYSMRHPPKDDGDALHTVRLALRIPYVLILSDYDHLPMREVHLSREGILARDEYVCQYCGKKFSEQELTIDHVIPRERGGRNTWENLVTACRQCNSLKANRLPHEAGMKLTRKPRRPPRMPFAATAIIDAAMIPQWRPFLGRV
jgi:5-methylcytosine-specific restriction endonuclease McrA